MSLIVTSSLLEHMNNKSMAYLLMRDIVRTEQLLFEKLEEYTLATPSQKEAMNSEIEVLKNKYASSKL